MSALYLRQLNVSVRFFAQRRKRPAAPAPELSRRMRPWYRQPKLPQQSPPSPRRIQPHRCVVWRC